MAGGLGWRHDPRLRVPSLLRLSEAHTLAFLRRVACPVLLVRPDQGSEPLRATLPARLAAVAASEIAPRQIPPDPIRGGKVLAAT